MGYIYSGSFPYSEDSTSLTFNDCTISGSAGIKSHLYFNGISINRIDIKNSYPTALKNTPIIWIVRGTKLNNSETVVWRSPDTPSANLAPEPIKEGSLKVVGYFYDDS